MLFGIILGRFFWFGWNILAAGCGFSLIDLFQFNFLSYIQASQLITNENQIIGFFLIGTVSPNLLR